MTSRTTHYVSSIAFERMADMCSCSHIAEGRSIAGTIHHLNQEYVITGAMGTGTGKGWAKLWGYNVVDIANYAGALIPLEYVDHGRDVDAGNRERGYHGMLIRHGKRQLVCLKQFEFLIGHQVEQLSIF